MADLKGKKQQCQIQIVRDEDRVGVEKRKDILEVLAMHWEGLVKVSQSVEGVQLTT